MSHIELVCSTAWCSHTLYGSLAQGPETPSACCGADLKVDDEHGRRYGTHPMGHGDQQVLRQCKRPTTHLRTHRADVLQTMSSGAQCSEAVPTLTQLLEVNG
jgi:hypothetical protein